MKKKSIQKLKVHKQTISTLHKLTGGDGITATSMTSKPKPKEPKKSVSPVHCIVTLLLPCL